MKKAKKILALLLCAVLLVGASVAGTVAYLTDKDNQVTNTFTIGNIEITLKEYAVDPQSGLKDTSSEVDKLENLELVPGREIQKHPFVTVVANSEPCYLFVKVVNGLEAYEDKTADGNTIAAQLDANGWEPLTGVANVYYYETVIPTSTDAQVKPLFTSVKIDKNADAVNGWADIATNGNIVINAYAIQSEGFADAAAAWAGLGIS